MLNIVNCHELYRLTPKPLYNVITKALHNTAHNPHQQREGQLFYYC